ncbi:hypothetical protein Egran_06280 [Elaphomyces granulatus]|uniref:SUMO ligase SizA n=1 Tax=Elaphomyces granulatus TaxID=519963 RepID=A0A232LP98_9EURO|nr:hypothetical protein Egran_06280 [Elaphomyces granulatus]
MASTGQAPDLPSVIAQVKTLTNAQLKDILRNEGLPVSGVKISLQSRIITYMERLYERGHNEHYNRLKKFIYAPNQRAILNIPTHTPSQPYRTTPNQPSINAQNRQSVTATMPSQPFSVGRLTFKDSPFYTILEALTPAIECKAREQTRDSVELKVVLNTSVAARLQLEQNLRVMVYCAADTGLTPFSNSDISFPHQVELKTNLDDVKANLRGLKNKPGSTRPADITNYIRKKAGYTNHVVMTYALTQKTFYVLVNLVQRHPVDELVAELKTRKIISKEQVIREMRSKAEDADIVATSSVMSLKCPLSTLRIQVPCRSVVCTHNQCFDASSFLQLQEQAPTWTCPVCNKSTSFESLQTDQYVDNILCSTSTQTDSVTIEPNGDWHTPGNGETPGTNGVTPNTDDDDLIEIKKPDLSPLKPEIPDDTPPQRTPASREPSAVSSSTRHSSSKRPAPQIIDLTGSGDEDELRRPEKRQAFDLSERILPRKVSQNSFSSNTLIGAFSLSSQNNSESPRQLPYYCDA